MNKIINIEHNNERVLTTEQLAQAYGCEGVQIKQNFNNNADRFVEGQHYFKLEGEALRKLRVENIDLQISPMTRSLYLWTRRFADSGQNREMYIINESGMYDLVFGSKLPTAKKFKHWVTSEVLPALRKTGSYTMPKMSKELQAIVMLDGKQEKLREEFEDFKGEIPLFTTECKEIQGIVRKVGVSALGGKKAPAYQNRSLRSRIYGDIQRELKRQFDVRRYESIHRSQFPIARDIVKNYVVPVALRSEIAKENAQA